MILIKRCCPGCGSEGFRPSILGPDRCEFCDGTFGGVGPLDTYRGIHDILWTPDRYPLAAVAAAAEAALAAPDMLSRDIHQATYLITTMRPR